MTGLDDFTQKYGKDKLLEVLNAINNHTAGMVAKLPEDDEQRLYFSLLEMFGWECFKYGDAPKWLPKTEAMDFLKEHRDEIKCEMPSYLAIFMGLYNFLLDPPDMTEQEKEALK